MIDGPDILDVPSHGLTYTFMPGGQFNRIIENLFENLFEILVLQNLIEKYFLVL